MFDASTVGLLCAISVVFGVLLGLYHSIHYIKPVPASEVARRTRPRVPGKRRDAPAPTNPVDVE